MAQTGEENSGQELRLRSSDAIPSASLPDGPVPLPTSPFSFKSMYHVAVSPCAFLSVKAKRAPPRLMAALRSTSSPAREVAMRSKASEAGKVAAE